MKISFKVVAGDFNKFLRNGVDVSFLNFNSLGEMARFSASELNKFAFCLDGGLLCLFARAKGLWVSRVSFDFTSIASSVFHYCEREGRSVFIVGGTREDAERFEMKVRSLFSGLEVAGVSGGYLSDQERSQLIFSDQLRSADVLIVGLGAGRQEQFMLDARAAGFTGFGISCGAFISQTARTQGMHYYPPLINSLRLRFLYRMYREPHTIRRYVLNYPLNIIRFVMGRYCFIRC